MIELSVNTVETAKNADRFVFGEWTTIGGRFLPFRNEPLARILFPFDGTLSPGATAVLRGISLLDGSRSAFIKLLTEEKYAVLAIDADEFELVYKNGWGLPGFRICSATKTWGGVFSPRDAFCVIGAPDAYVRESVQQLGGYEQLRRDFSDYVNRGGIGFGPQGLSFGRDVLLPLCSRQS